MTREVIMVQIKYYAKRGGMLHMMLEVLMVQIRY